MLLDAGRGGLRADGRFGANATLLVEFNVSAHDAVGAAYRHEFVSENASWAFPGGRWELSDPSDPYSGVHVAEEGLLFSEALGARYEGVWLSKRELLVTVRELGGAGGGGGGGGASSSSSAADGGGSSSRWACRARIRGSTGARRRRSR